MDLEYPSGHDFYSPFTWILLDDLVDCGGTWRRVSRTLTKKWRSAKCVGVYQYSKHDPSQDHLNEIAIRQHMDSAPCLNKEALCAA